MRRSLASAPLRFFVALVLSAAALDAAQGAGGATILLVNNQPFRVRMPVRIRDAADVAVGAAIQRIGNDCVFVADVRPGGREQVGPMAAPLFSSALVLAPAPSGIALQFGERDAGRLTWDIFLKRVAPPARDSNTAGEPPDFAAAFAALPLAFHRTLAGPVADVWLADAQKAGLRLQIELTAYRAGFLDVRTRLTNETAEPETGVYAAVVVRWEQPSVTGRVLCEDNRVRPLAAADSSSFRRGEGRHLFTERGVDWVNTTFAPGGAAWLNDFAPSFTRLDSSSRNTFGQPRYYGANLPQLGTEVQVNASGMFAVTEIARSNIRSYRDRLAENALPARGDSATFSSLVVFSPAPLPSDEVDRTFVGYTSYNAQQRSGAIVTVSLGVPSVRFGTAYFPYSTLGENFDAVKLPGMDRESFWPLAADTVLHWQKFADDIRRDIRLIKAMGFATVRLHHLELLAPLPAETRREYLDFLFGELRHVQLRAMVDVYGSAQSIAELVSRYADVIESVELENETLIWGIPLDRPEQWKQTYAAIKAVAPEVRVHLTGYNNTGMFDRLATLGVPFDRIGLHSYVDSLEALPTARGYALALGSYASKTGKPPVITEWNWRGLTKMTPEARAAIYPAIFENALSTRAIPEIHQFQFNETLAPNPRLGRGNILRHYELVHLSRRLKPEAFELMKLIEKYATADDPVRRLAVSPALVALDQHGAGAAVITLTNHAPHTVHWHVTIESPAALTATLAGNADVTMAPNGTATLHVNLQGADQIPGWRHAFVRLENDQHAIRYGWIEARLAGTPKFDTVTAAPADVVYPQGLTHLLQGNSAAPCVVAYGNHASVLEIETAFAIAETLEAASGCPIDALQADDAAAAESARGLVIAVGTVGDSPRVAAFAKQFNVSRHGFVTTTPAAGTGPTHLDIGGRTAEDVERAGMDFLLRYWKEASASAASRVGLEAKALPRGVDATKLP